MSDWLIEYRQRTSPQVMVEDDSALQPLHAAPQSNWVTTLAVAAAVFFATLWWTSAPGPSPTPAPDPGPVPTPTPGEDLGQRVLFLWQDGQSIQAGQSSVLKSTKVADYIEGAGYEYRNLPVDANFDAMETEWSKLRDKAEPPPSMTVTKSGNTFSVAVPNSIDKVREVVK